MLEKSGWDLYATWSINGWYDIEAVSIEPAEVEEMVPTKPVENYSKGGNHEEPLVKDRIPIPNLPLEFLWMQVQGGSKMRNLLDMAIPKFAEGRDVLWTGSGAALGKAISCAEVLKRKFKDVHQFNKILYRKCEELWDPKIDGLDQLVVVREVPMIHIFLSHQPINTDLPGYQAPRQGGKQAEPVKNKTRRSFNKPKLNPHLERSGLRFNKGKPKNVVSASASSKTDQ